jgi:hypothetical protein
MLNIVYESKDSRKLPGFLFAPGLDDGMNACEQEKVKPSRSRSSKSKKPACHPTIESLLLEKSSYLDFIRKLRVGLLQSLMNAKATRELLLEVQVSNGPLIELFPDIH